MNQRSADPPSLWFRLVFLGLLAVFASPAPRAWAHAGAHDEIAAATAIVERGPCTAADYLRRGELYRIHGDWKAARADYDQAARIVPGLPEIELCRAALDLDSGSARSAKRRLDAFLERRPDHPEALLMRARAERRLGSTRAAVTDFDRGLAVHPRPTPDHYYERARLVGSLGPSFAAEALRGVEEGIRRLGPATSLRSLASELEEEVARRPVSSSASSLAPSTTVSSLSTPRSATPVPALERAIRLPSAVLPEAARPVRPAALLTRGPYLQSGSSTGITVCWRTDVATDSRVQYGPAPGLLPQNVTLPDTTTEHFVRLSGLTPSTEFFYSVGSSTETLAGDDLDHFFIISPPPGPPAPTRLWVIGDSGTAGDSARAVRDGYLSYAGSRRADLWLMLGDNAYNTGTDAEYQAAVFNMYPALLRNTVLWPTRGNHDVLFDGPANDYYEIFSLPQAGECGGQPTGTEAYYSFDHGNIHFVCLDSEGSDRTRSGPMLTWLHNDLAANARDWTIAFWHHPPFTKGSHDSDSLADSGGRMWDMRTNALPILEQAGVDLVLSGHSHSYERSFLLHGHYGISTTLTASMIVDGGDGRPNGNGFYRKPAPGWNPDEGAVYTVAGSSGMRSGGLLNHPVMVSSLNLLGSMVLDIAGSRLEARFIDQNGTVRDSFYILKGATLETPHSRPASAALDLTAAPNPTSGAASVEFVIPRDGEIRLTVLDVKGREVAELASGRYLPGRYVRSWSGEIGGGRAAAGVYFIRLVAPGGHSVRRVVILP